MLKTAFASAALLFGASAMAEPMVGLRLFSSSGARNSLIHFDSANPGTVLNTVDVVGPHFLVGIDMRPATGELYGLDVAKKLWVINPFTGVSTEVSGGEPITQVVDDGLGFDFSPVADRIRVVTVAGANFRLNPNAGAGGLAAVDTALSWATGDVNTGQETNIGAAAYNNNVAGASSANLYVIDGSLSILALQEPANSGILQTVGPLGILTGEPVGFDISGNTGIAYLLADLRNPNDEPRMSLFTVNLSTGAATRIGAVGALNGVQGVAVLPEPGAMCVLVAGIAASAIGRGWGRVVMRR
jgi:hypothetical protein